MFTKIIKWFYVIKVSRDIEAGRMLLKNNEITLKEYINYIENLRVKAP